MTFFTTSPIPNDIMYSELTKQLPMLFIMKKTKNELTMFTLRLALDLLAIDNIDPSWLAFIISWNREPQVKINTFF